MLSIGGNLAARTNVQTLPEPKKDSVASDAPETTLLSEPKAVEGVTVTFSGASLNAAAAEKAANEDIDDSGLADNVKQLLKMIRQLKQQIVEKQAEMAAVMADKSLSPDQAQARLGGLQTALSGLQAGLTAAQASLLKAIKDMSAGDAVKTASLSMS
ncbi:MULTISPECIES: hypothetical protein [unclassified Pseudomonas]|uniref:hypothetical protein n=1 Tax=unclassified Pseudomonas TaxID=196821 RepID=UPI0011EDDEA3|nr:MULTISPECIES: hypothetical protein [unclassified Pseudomonas]KAA0948146.1 hypothetical protein FQ182_06870 [Pseudomonas sp. ANT_H4]KAA0952054.1 hypothetical protein FQ186_12780 [Pseudomonas sp. ANT_H14]